MESLVIGFCICKKCGWSDNKFNWHTYFKCPECGCCEYVKEKPEHEKKESDIKQEMSE